jgi:vacuolar-type H+-ATPase subunit D/Vma8
LEREDFTRLKMVKKKKEEQIKLEEKQKALLKQQQQQLDDDFTSGAEESKTYEIDTKKSKNSKTHHLLAEVEDEDLIFS